MSTNFFKEPRLLEKLTQVNTAEIYCVQNYRHHNANQNCWWRKIANVFRSCDNFCYSK